jgi:hypothetical protein
LIEKGIKKPIEGVMLTSAQRETMQKAQKKKKNQQALIIIHQCLDDITFKIMINATNTKQV